MPPSEHEEHAELKHLLKKHTELLEENNRLLKKMHRNATIAFWMRIIWYVLLIGLPFALYYYLLEPYFTAMGSNYEVFIQGMNQLPGFQGLDQLMENLSRK